MRCILALPSNFISAPPASAAAAGYVSTSRHRHLKAQPNLASPSDRVRNDRSKLFFCVHRGQQNRSIVGKLERRVLVHPPISSVAKYSAVNGGTRNIIGSERLQQRVVEGPVMPLVLLANQDAHHLCLRFQFGGWRDGLRLTIGSNWSDTSTRLVVCIL